MPINPDRNYGQILTASVAKRQRKIQDIVYKATPLTRILLDENRIQEKRAGGPELRIPLEFDKLEAQWFTGYDKLKISPKELLNSAVFNWSRVVSMFSLNGTELMFNSGAEQVIDLLSFTMRAAEKSLKESFEAALIGDGTADGGRQLIGFGGAVPIVPNTGIYGGINRADVGDWRTTTYNIPNGDVPGVTVWDSTTALQTIDFITRSRSRGENYPDLWICDNLSYEAIRAAFVATQRTIVNSERAGRLGFTGMTYLSGAGPVDIVCASGIGSVMPANTIFGVDTKSLSIYSFPGQNFVPFHPGNGIRTINQDAVAQGIVWSGQMVLENPLFTVRVITA